LSNEPLMVDVVAVEESTVLFINMKKLISSKYKSHIVMNLLKVSAKKNLNLSRRIFHTSSKNIRGRILSYLSYQSLINNSKEFEIPFNRQQLADYLNVDRSALSAELSKMQKDGFLDFHKNHFLLKELD
ncbi:MAG: helix-turn-helix domain-containing protein, partial [Treponema sp.]|nr:helix-turn-helix domain-containing protein [Treponema sp.]